MELNFSRGGELPKKKGKSIVSVVISIINEQNNMELTLIFIE